MQGRRAVELLMTKDLGRPGVEKTAHVAALRLHKVWIRQHFKNHPLFPWWMLQWIHWIHWILLAQGEEHVVSTGRSIFWVPQGQVRDFCWPCCVQWWSRMMGLVWWTMWAWSSWMEFIGKRPESRDKKISELSGVNVFWGFWTSPSSFSWRLHMRLYIHNGWVMLN